MSQVEKLTRLRRTTADQASDRKRISLHLSGIEKERDRLQRHEATARKAGRADLADEVVIGLTAVEQGLESIRKQYDRAVERERQLAQENAIMSSRLDAFRVLKEAFKSDYRSAPQMLAISISPDHSGPGILRDDEIDDKRAIELAQFLGMLSPKRGV
jgi:phage shock protein A